jgi:hypothetical protein
MKQAQNNLVISYLFAWYGAPVSLANRQMMAMINNRANREVTTNFTGY